MDECLFCKIVNDEIMIDFVVFFIKNLIINVKTIVMGRIIENT